MTTDVTVTYAVAHFRHDCGEMLVVPIDDLDSPVRCSGCGGEEQLEPQAIAAARQGYRQAWAEAARQGEEEGADHVRLLVKVDAADHKRDH